MSRGKKKNPNLCSPSSSESGADASKKGEASNVENLISVEEEKTIDNDCAISTQLGGKVTSNSAFDVETPKHDVKSWSSLFKRNRVKIPGCALNFVQPVVSNGKQVAKIRSEETKQAVPLSLDKKEEQVVTTQHGMRLTPTSDDEWMEVNEKKRPARSTAGKLNAKKETNTARPSGLHDAPWQYVSIIKSREQTMMLR
ncbi:hypothetical protein ACFE04_031348 [Oxalis oulophora]